MQFTSLFISLLLSIAVVANGNKTTKDITDKNLCKEMANLNKLVALAANTTKLDDKTKSNATKIADIQAKASSASTALAAMSSNTTLVETCSTIEAAAKTKQSCDEMKSLQKLITLASNETAIANKAKNNSTKIAAFQAKASTAVTKLETMTTNTTLVSACSALASAKAAAKAEKDNQNSATSSTSPSSASPSLASPSSASTSASNILISGADTLSVRAGGVLSAVTIVASGMLILSIW